MIHVLWVILIDLSEIITTLLAFFWGGGGGMNADVNSWLVLHLKKQRFYELKNQGRMNDQLVYHCKKERWEKFTS